MGSKECRGFAERKLPILVEGMMTTARGIQLGRFQAPRDARSGFGVGRRAPAYGQLRPRP